MLEKAGLESHGRFEREIVRPNLGPQPRPSLYFSRRAEPERRALVPIRLGFYGAGFIARMHTLSLAVCPVEHG